jgi:hypothetical protein
MARDDKLKVFISYARSDGSSFAEELLTGLEVAGFAPFLDRHDIAPGEDWEHRLEGLIEAADTIVFVVSPKSVASERCSWELQRAEALGKRFIPVVAIDVPEGLAPKQLARHNYIYFSRGASFSRSLKDLATALSTDVDWIREHTRLMDLAHRWVARNRSDALLLRGPELRAAEHWLDSATGELELTANHREFIRAAQEFEAHEAADEKRRSVALEDERAQTAVFRVSSRRRLLVALGAGLAAVGAAGWGWWMSGDGERQKHARIEIEAKRRLQGQTVVYATGIGAAADVRVLDDISLFSRSVFDALADPDVPMLPAITSAYSNIRNRSNGAQTPTLSTTMNGDFYLHHASPTRKLKALVVSASQVGAQTFNTVERDGDAWADLLAEAGFRVTRLSNPTFDDFSRVDQNFMQQDIESAELLLAVTPFNHRPKPLPETLYAVIFIGEGALITEQRRLCFKDTAFENTNSLTETSVDPERIAADLRESALASILVVNSGFIYEAKS